MSEQRKCPRCGAQVVPSPWGWYCVENCWLQSKGDETPADYLARICREAMTDGCEEQLPGYNPAMEALMR